MELMMVTVVLGVMAGIAVPAYQGTVELSRYNEAKVNLNIIHMCERLYYLNNNNTYWGPGSTTLSAMNTALNSDMSANYFPTISVTKNATAGVGYIATLTRTGGGKSFTYDYTTSGNALVCKEDNTSVTCW